MSISDAVRAELERLGADIYGFGDLRELPEAVRHGLPTGICVALKYPKEVIRGVADFPTQEYHEHYNELNTRLDRLVSDTAEFLKKQGFSAIAQTRAAVSTGISSDTVLPHKTVATRAAIGWIGKCAMLVTEEFGSAIRLSAVLTDAPLETATPVNRSKCAAGCNACKNGCPANAVSGKLWGASIHRDEFFDSTKCGETTRERSLRGFGVDVQICGKCIEVCPWTRKYLLG